MNTKIAIFIRWVRWRLRIWWRGDKLYRTCGHWAWKPPSGMTVFWPESEGRMPPPLDLSGPWPWKNYHAGTYDPDVDWHEQVRKYNECKSPEERITPTGAE